MKMLDLTTLRYDGYLQEANRLFFHPLGLALGVELTDDEKPVDLIICDFRHSEEGVYFGDLTDEDSVRKYHKIREELEARAVARCERFDSDSPVQPMHTLVEDDE